MLTDAIDFQVSLASPAAARPSFNVAAMLHTLTDAQYAAMGANRAVSLTASSWATTLASLGITSSEPAYLDAQAHFSQARKPTTALLARRGKDVAQVWTVVVPASPSNGVYAISVAGATGSPYSFTASGSTQSAVRTALVSALAAGSATFTAANGVGAGDITITAVTPGVALSVLVSSPSSSMTASITTSLQVASVAQVSTITVTSATLGVYTLTVQTTTGQKTYTHIATTGATTTTIRDAIKAAYDADPSDLFGATMTSVSTNQGTLTASLAGRPGTVSLVSPSTNASVATTTANYGVKEDIDALVAFDNSWYLLLLGSHADADVLLAAEKVESLQKILGVQTSTAAVKSSATTDVVSVLKARNYDRTFAVYHPTDADGVHAAWAAIVLTSAVGSISWAWKQLAGITAPTITATENVNLRAKDCAFLERFSAAQVSAMNGGYNVRGRPIDIVRAVDQFRSNVELSLFDLLSTSDIVPYTSEGVTIVEGVIRSEFENGVSAGYAIAQSLLLTKPSLASATASQAQRGVMPAFTGSAKFQAGTYKITGTFTVSQ